MESKSKMVYKPGSISSKAADGWNLGPVRVGAQAGLWRKADGSKWQLGNTEIRASVLHRWRRILHAQGWNCEEANLKVTTIYGVL